ncbi:MAG TPA: acylphosphatase [Alphaproteobacteria bacterium]|jgi:acylphosphatase
MTTGGDEPRTMALHLRIKGRVQGVFFRRWVVEEATRRGLRGWVRNRSDGSVETVISGEMAAVRDMAKACRRGPPRAAVTDVVQIPGEYRPGEEDFPEGFRQLPTV